jgi:hypothetical protein
MASPCDTQIEPSYNMVIPALSVGYDCGRLFRVKIIRGTMTKQFSRRGVLALAFAAGGTWTFGVAGTCAFGADGTAPAKVSEKDSLAVALGYVSDAKRVDPKSNPGFQAGANCSGCSWYQGKPGDAGGGPCTFFPGKTVDARGWCRMWSKKP